MRFWLSGPAEDGYGPTLERVLDRCAVPVTVGRGADRADAYAAADVVVFPSTWEGFGNPIDRVDRRPPSVRGVPLPRARRDPRRRRRLFSTEAAGGVVKFLAEPDDVRDRYFDVNLRRARLSYALADLPRAIDEAFATHGWITW